MLSRYIVSATVAAVTVIAVPTQQSPGPGIFGHSSKPPSAPRPEGSFFIPSTNIPMTNVFQGYMNECADACRLHSACLAFPWGYQTCFNTQEPKINFSYDGLSGTRQQCEVSIADRKGDTRCPERQICLPEVFDAQGPRRQLRGWCVQNNVYQMNHDAYCKGRYQKADGVWVTDKKDGKRPAMYLRKPAWLPKASFDDDFTDVNPNEMPQACKEPLNLDTA